MRRAINGIRLAFFRLTGPRFIVRTSDQPWTRLSEIDLPSGRAWIGDTSFLPLQEEGLIVSLPAGCYEIDFKSVVYESAPRLVRLRLRSAGSDPVLDEKVGDVWSDVSCLSIVDFETANAFFANEELSEEESDRLTSSDRPIDIELRRGKQLLAVPVVPTGADGSWPVFALVQSGMHVGFEAVLIQEGTDLVPLE